MTISMYQASVPVFRRALTNLDVILGKALDHASAHDIDPAVLFGARLFPDMFPLSRQVQIATDFTSRAVDRLAGTEPPSVADSETTIDELRSRIAGAMEKLDGCRPGDIDGSEERPIKLKLPTGEMAFNGETYLQYFVIPNLYFHITTAYNILRHNGVPLGKNDFMGRP